MKVEWDEVEVGLKVRYVVLKSPKSEDLARSVEAVLGGELEATLVGGLVWDGLYYLQAMTYLETTEELIEVSLEKEGSVH